MIADYLLPGKVNARTGSDLAKLCGCDPREITAQIEKERRAGKPICASCDPEKPGYYLAETAEELQQYCGRLHRRAGEIHKTRRALLKAAKHLPAGDPQEAREHGNKES